MHRWCTRLWIMIEYLSYILTLPPGIMCVTSVSAKVFELAPIWASLTNFKKSLAQNHEPWLKIGSKKLEEYLSHILSETCCANFHRSCTNGAPNGLSENTAYYTQNHFPSIILKHLVFLILFKSHFNPFCMPEIVFWQTFWITEQASLWN